MGNNTEKDAYYGLGRRDVLKLAGAAVVGMGGVALTGSSALAALPPGFGGAIARFGLSVDGVEVAEFNQLDALRMALDRASQGEAGESAPQFEVVLKKNFDLPAAIYTWFTDALAGKKAGRKSAELVGFDVDGAPRIRWELAGAFPSEILTSGSGPTFGTQLTLVAASITHRA